MAEEYVKVPRKIEERYDLCLSAKLIYGHLIFRMKMSQHKAKYFSKKYQARYVVYSMSELANRMATTNYQIRKGLRNLMKVGLLVAHHGTHCNLLFLPKYSKDVPTNQPAEFQPIQTKSEHKFHPISKIDNWMQRARKIGIQMNAIEQIAKFSSSYHQSAYKLCGLVNRARNAVARQNHLSKEKTRFENNANIQQYLGNKLNLLFSDIISQDYHKATLTNYGGFLVNSLKNFFVDCFALRKHHKVYKPKMNHYNHRYTPHTEGLPAWFVKQHPEYAPKHPHKDMYDKWCDKYDAHAKKEANLKPTSQDLQRSIKRRLAHLDEMSKSIK